jgi:hypothetical protein
MVIIRLIETNFPKNIYMIRRDQVYIDSCDLLKFDNC